MFNNYPVNGNNDLNNNNNDNSQINPASTPAPQTPAEPVPTVQNSETPAEPAPAVQNPETPAESAPTVQNPETPVSHSSEPQQTPSQNPYQQPQQNPPQNPYSYQGYSQPQNNYGGYPPYTPNQHTYSSYNPAPTPEPQKKPKKKKTGISAGAMAIVIVCSLLLSCASGFLGAHLATANYVPSAESAVPSQSNSASGEKAPSVIYQAAPSPAEGMSSTAGATRYYDVASAVKASVVEITTEFRVNSYFQYVTSGAGSGVIISTDGYIITNNHVISDSSSQSGYADTITVRLTNGEEYKATIVGADADSDIAVIKIEAPAELPCAVMGNSDELGVGEEVIAVGNPLGELGGTVTNGIISALNREINVDGTTMNLLQTNTAINPGNSGGGLFNMDGELIGIVNAKSSGSDIEGLGFAIPVNEAVSVSEQLITQGYVSGRPYLGVEFYNATSMSQALYYGLPSLGIYVAALEEGLNDEVFQVADRVIAVDGQEIGSFSDISTIVKSHKPGDKIPFSVYRKGKLIEVEATCYEYVPELTSAEDAPAEKSPLSGKGK